MKKDYFPSRLQNYIAIYKDIIDAERMNLRYSRHLITYNEIINSAEIAKKFKLGNCGESADLVRACAIANGIKNHHSVSLYAYKEKGALNLDHNIILVNLSKNADWRNCKTFGKKAYVIDAWYGFADYVSNAFKFYAKKNQNEIKEFNAETLGIFIHTNSKMNSDEIELTKKFASFMKFKK